tara:strand:- start:45 stop:374 length:330 start_codon:yes stop_codon:yes gene_type:complete
MSENYLEIDKNHIVINSIIASKSDIEFGVFGEPSRFIKNNDSDSGKNIGGIGDKYDSSKNDFIRPKPYDSWILNSKNQWEPPKPVPGKRGPNNKIYIWDETKTDWVLNV